MNIQEQYRKNANHFITDAYEMDFSGDMVEETAKSAFIDLISGPEFFQIMRKYLIDNELVPVPEAANLVIEEFKNTILPEVESLIRTIGR